MLFFFFSFYSFPCVHVDRHLAEDNCSEVGVRVCVGVGANVLKFLKSGSDSNRPFDQVLWPNK